MAKKFVSIFLALSMCMSVASVAFAVEPRNEGDFQHTEYTSTEPYDDTYWKTIPVTLEDGTTIEVLVHFDENLSTGSPTTRAITPRYPVGTVKPFNIIIKNSQLTAGLTVGGSIGVLAKTKIGSIVASVLNANFVGAAFTAAVVLNAIGSINELVGNNGFVISGHVVYKATFIHKEGHNVYGWSIKDINLHTY